MKKTILISLLTFTCFMFYSHKSSAQLHIHYNLHTDNTKYILNGKEVTSPKVKKGTSIELHIEEFNDYIFTVEVELIEKDDEAPGTGGIPFNSLQGMSEIAGSMQAPNSGMNVPSTNLGELAPIPIEEEVEGSEENLKSSRGAASILISQVNQNLTMIWNMHSKMQASIEEIQKLSTALEVVSISDQKINELKFNPKLKPSIIKELTVEYSNAVFQKEDSESINIKDIIEWNKIPQKVKIIKGELMKNNLAYIALVNQTKLRIGQLQNFTFDNDNILDKYDLLENRINTASEDSGKVQHFIDNLAIGAANTSVNDLFDLRVKVAEVKSNDFTFHHSATSKKDQVELKAMIMYNDSLQKKTKQIKVLKTKSFIIPTYGGIKVDASVGIAFGQFFDKPLSYFKEDSTNIIVSSELDDFLPIIASFIHFYPSTSGNISVGGTFGVGFPVTGNESLQSIFFFLGPTILLGKNDRVVLSAGMMGGRNKSLSKGFQLGDVVEGPGEIPTISSYELGGFVGISFNLTAKK